MRVWPQFRSSLTWDVAAVTTYFTVSLLFWYLGLVPDLAIVRDRAPGHSGAGGVYGLLALGWRGSNAAWHRYRIAYGLLGGLATPLVISVHSIVSMDFAIANLPGWHSTIFPPYFVAGALFSGFAMVLTLMLPVRHLYRLENVITEAHLDNMGKMMLVTGWIVTYSVRRARSSSPGSAATRFEMWSTSTLRPFGPYAAAFWIVIFCNVMTFRRCSGRASVRTAPMLLFIVTLFVQLGMWMERFMLIVTSQAEDFLPSSWRSYRPSAIDLTILFGTISFFLFLFLLFLRFVPFIPISDLKQMRFELRREAREDAGSAMRHARSSLSSTRPRRSSAPRRSRARARLHAARGLHAKPDARARREARGAALEDPRSASSRRASPALATAFLIIWFCNAVNYPLNVGGRPLDSIVADIPIMFETTVLFAGIGAFSAALATNRLPRLHDDVGASTGSRAPRSTASGFASIATIPALHERVIDHELDQLGAVAVRRPEEAP